VNEKILKELIGNPQDMQFARVIENGFKTLDGRISGPVLGTPGGDAGEFILALEIYSELMGRNVHLTENKVYNIFRDYLQYMKQDTFYMATDDSAIRHIEKQLNIIGLNIQSPKQSNIEDLLSIIDQPENIGDLHIKLLLSETQNYSLNKTLVQYFLKAYYRTLWDTSSDNSLSHKLNLDILAGDHNEVAFIEIKTDIECLRNNRAPMMVTHDGKNKVQVFINHIDAVSLQRAELSKFFTLNVGHSNSAT